MSFEFLTNILFPRICVACKSRIEHGVICESCFKSIAILDALYCGMCSARIPGANPQPICHFNYPCIVGAAGDYDNPALKNLIHNLKFRSIRDAAEPLAELLLQYVQRLGLDFEDWVVVPVPLSRARHRTRGFNQSELIARHFSQNAGLPIEIGALIRTKHSKPQSESKSVADRQENVRGGFLVKIPEAVRGKKILLIDDVSTSGATFFEASLALKAAKAKKVIALACAKVC